MSRHLTYVNLEIYQITCVRGRHGRLVRRLIEECKALGEVSLDREVIKQSDLTYGWSERRCGVYELLS